VKSFLLSFVLIVGLLNATSTTTKIKNSKNSINKNKTAKKMTSHKLTNIARDIKSTENELKYINKKIDQLEIKQTKSEKKYKELQREIAITKKDYRNINKHLKQKAKAFIALLSEQFSIIFALEKSHEPTRNSIITQEIYRAYKIQNDNMIKNIKRDIQRLKKDKNKILKQYRTTRANIALIEKKRANYKAQKRKKEKLKVKLAKDEERYSQKLSHIQDKQGELRSTLARLNILQKNEVLEAQRLAMIRKEEIKKERLRQRKLRRQKALAISRARKAKERLKQAKNKEDKERAKLALKEAQDNEKEIYQKSIKVRKINSSYKKPLTYAYRGGKTISPISGARVVKRFGTYIDPIYKIKIFNDSITLKAPYSNAKVKNVLNGKVVFSGNSSMLGKVVVVLHGNKIHTIYAGLSKIAPTIHVGAKIQRGYVLGKVNQKLLFQATKNSKHINPLKLIRI